MKALGALLLVMFAVAAGFLFVSSPRPELAPAPLVSAPVAPAPPPQVETPAPPAPPRAAPALEDPFCSASGVESFKLRFTLEQAVNEWIKQQRADGGSEPGAVELLRALGQSSRLTGVRDVAARWPDFLPAQLTLAIEAQLAGQSEERLAALRRARKLAPDDPAIGWAISEATRYSGDLDEAIAGLSAFLARDPNPEVSRLRARLEVARDIQQGYERQTRNGVTILWPSASLSSSQANEIAGQVDRSLDDAAALTGTERRQTLTVVVYPSRSELLAVSCARAWAAALFDGTLRVVANTTPEGVDSRELRHETLHAQLSPLAPSAPKWFHEGVAQSFAREPPPTKVWGLMVKNRTWVPFTSLDGSFQAFEGASDAELAYAQAYGLVELMRELGADASIATARAAFQSGADTPTALARACRRSEVTGEELITFLSARLTRPR